MEWWGKVQLKCVDGRKLLTWLLWGGPLSKGRALIAYLIGRGSSPFCLLDWQGAQALLGGLVIFLLFLDAAKS